MAEVCYSCPFVPAELIISRGHTPCRLQSISHPYPGAAETEGLCAWAGAFVDALTQQTNLGAAVFSTACDQMRRAYELCTTRSNRPAFLLNVPTTAGPAALDLLTEEYRRLGRFLTNLNGPKTPQDMSHSYDETPQHSPVAERGRLAVVGGPLFDADREQLRQLIHGVGQAVVFDGTETEWKRGRRPFDTNALQDASFAALAQHYLTTPAIWKRPAEPFFDWLARQIETYAAAGVIIIQHPFCDYWRAAVYDIKGRVKRPVVAIETGAGGHLSAAALSRLEAFLEQCEQ